MSLLRTVLTLQTYNFYATTLARRPLQQAPTSALSTFNSAAKCITQSESLYALLQGIY